MSELSAERIREVLQTSTFGRQVLYFPTIGSTNDEAKAQAEAGAPEGLLVLADYQTAGRGRMARRWWAPPGSSLLMSVLFRPTFLAPHQAQRLTMLCSLALVEAIAEVTGLSAGVKWPNDVVIGERKVCGILTELGTVGRELRYAVVGLGVNVNVDFTQAPPLMYPATSLQQESGRPVSRLSLLKAFLEHLEARYQRLQAGESPHTEWEQLLVMLGRTVNVTTPQGALTGEAIGVDADGALLLRTADGVTHRLLAGDVSLRACPKNV